ncbi:FAD-dependent oxidoreductase [Thermodesulfobacteriota bacterium]
MAFQVLFEPGNIGSMTLRNRIVMAPMGTGAMQNPDGGFSRRLRDYYEARARGGAGLIMTGSTLMTRVTGAEARRAGATLFLDATYVGGASELCDAVHRHGAKMCIQLTPGEGRLFSYGSESPVAPSDGIRGVWNPRTSSRAASREEIGRIVQDYGTTARLAKSAGFDAIELRAYGGYFVDQFMSSLWNSRDDEYGGDLDGRLKFLMEAIAAVRRGVGQEYPLIVKFTPDHFMEGGRQLEEGLEIARKLEEAGVDALHVDKGCYEVWYHAIAPVHMPLANQIDLAEAVKKAVTIPVIANGKLGVEPGVAAKALHQGKADFIALGRSLLADPDWPRKARNGTPSDIKPCIGCNCCLRRIFEGKYVSCAVNPQTGMEKELRVHPAATPKSVLVIGGGPGGMEAARTAALRGHTVMLCEKGAKLGGALRLASAPPFKRQMAALVDYYAHRLPALGVEIQLGKEMDCPAILERNADTVIVASGAGPMVPGHIADSTTSSVFMAEDVLLGKATPEQLGTKVVVVGGGEVGCETALHVAGLGSQVSVTIIEMLRRILPKTFINTRLLLEDMLRERAIRVHTDARLISVSEKKILVEQEGSEREIEADSVVLAVGYRSEASLAEELNGKVEELFTVGDCNEPRAVLDAVWEGFHAGRQV